MVQTDANLGDTAVSFRPVSVQVETEVKDQEVQRTHPPSPSPDGKVYDMY